MTSMTLNVRITGPLSEFVAQNIGHSGTYENASEYVRDLIRKDKAKSEEELLGRLKAELAVAFSYADDTYTALTAQDVFNRNMPNNQI